MKTLILLRHAKAEPGGPDHERPLTPRGQADAVRAAEAIKASGLRPDLALVSDARRTKETYAGLRAVFGSIKPVSIEAALYDAPWATILTLIKSAPDEVGCLLVVGHNPGIGEATRSLVVEGPEGAIADLRRRFPTAGSAVIEFPGAHWSDVEVGGTLKALFWGGQDD